jgi:uncharacterized protein YqhQ
MRYRHTGDTVWAAAFIVIIGLVIYSLVRIWALNNTTKVIDGCEYIRVYSGNGWNLIHKGNCTNIYHLKK